MERMPQHLDTQVVSYAMKGRWDRPLRGSVISSIVANELLLVQSENPTQARFYVPVLSARRTAGLAEFRRRDHPFGRRVSDSIVMDFGNEWPSIVEYNNLAIANVINQGLCDLWMAAINHLDKPTKRLLAARFRFLIENGVTCLPLRPDDVQGAFHLLREFTREHNIKRRFRNTWNDLLVLSSARNAHAHLVTEDSELSRFASELCSSVATLTAGDFVEIPFPQADPRPRRASRESRGYVNTGWRVQFMRAQRVGPDAAM